MTLHYGGVLMRKPVFYGICACLSLSLIAISNPTVQANNFASREDELMELCASSTLSNSNKDLCTEFNNYLSQKNRDLKNQISTSQTEIENTKSDITSIEQTLMALNDEIIAKQNEIEYLSISIANKQTDIDERENEVRDRMYAMQSHINSNSFINFIFGADSFTDMMSRMDSIEELTEYDKQLIIGLHNDKLAIEEQRSTAATAKANLEEKLTQQATLQTQYLALLNQQSEMLNTQQETLNQVEESSQAINKALEELEERSRQTQITGPVTVSGNSEVGVAIAQAALTQRGKPYTWGGNGPNSFDCSGLVFWAHNQVGVRLGRTTAAGYSRHGQAISFAETQAGDVVTFFKYGYVSHIGILIDSNGTMVHATGRANEINGQWGGTTRINHISEIGSTIHNFRRLY